MDDVEYNELLIRKAAAKLCRESDITFDEALRQVQSDDVEYQKRMIKRRARKIQKETGVKYTTALRQVQKELKENK